MNDEKYFVRRLVKPLIEFFKKTNISAEELTLFRLVFGFFTVAVLFQGIYIFSLISVFIYQFILFLDYIDGSIARYRNNFKISWVYLDLMMHIILSFLFLLAITVSNYLKTSSSIFLISGLLTCTFFLFNNIFNKKSSLDKWKEIHKNPKNTEKKRFVGLKVFTKIERPFGLFFILVMLNLHKTLILIYLAIYFFAMLHKFYSEFASLK